MKSAPAIIIAFILLFSSSLRVLGQQINMQSGYFEQCAGGFLDSGGGGGAYQNSENYTLTICPDVEGDVIGVDFLTFNLDPTNTASGNNNNQDRLIIYDGNSTAAPSLGTFTDNDLQGVFVSASPLNTTGCLTFRFISNNTGTGNWAGTITCETPCNRPIAVATDNAPANRRICIGQEVIFNGTGSTAAEGFSIDSYTWDFGDGTTVTGSVVAHTWDEPGEYLVELYLVDDNGCSSTNQVSLQIMVETLPDWTSFMGDTTICLGQTINWDVDPTDMEVTWIGAEPNQSVVVDDGLADVVGQCYDFPLVISGFGPGQTLDDIYSLLSIDMGIHHTYLFDLLIQISCPSGETVILHNQMQQPTGPNVPSNGTDFGNPPNECWNYSWTPQGTQTISQVATNLGWGGDPLPVDDYMSLQPLSELVGCDLNGTWTLSICDLWGGDSGYLCDWGLSIDPAIIPDVTEFTTTYGTGSDSTFWAGPSIGEVSADGNSITIVPEEVGEFEFTYSLINNHGCTHDSTVTITVVPGPEAFAGDDLIICTDSLQLNGSVAGLPPPPSSCEYTLEMYDSFGDGWNGFSVTFLQDGNISGNYTLTTGQSSGTATISVDHGSELQINTTSGLWNSEVSYFLYGPDGNLIFSDGDGPGNPIIGSNVWNGIADCQPGVPDFVFEWSPADGLSDPNVQNPMVMVGETTTYTLTVWEAGTPECGTWDDVTVEFIPNLNPGIDTTIQICYFEEPIALEEFIGGNPTPGGTWTDAAGNTIDPALFDPADLIGGGITILTYTVGSDNCEFSSNLTIEVQTSAENMECCITNAVAGEDYAICGLEAVLSAEAPLGTGTWTSDLPGAVFADINDSNTTVVVPEGGMYTFTFTDNNGINCSASDEMIVHFSPEITFDLIGKEDPQCAGACNGSIEFLVEGGIAPLSYSWSGGTANPANPAAANGFCGEEYLLTVTDAIGCSDTISFAFIDPPPPPVQAVSTSPECFGDCNGSISIIAPDAVMFTFDGGATYVPESTADSLCAGHYTVGLVDIYGCENTTNVQVIDPEQVVAAFNFSPDPPTILNSEVQFFNQSTPPTADSLQWHFEAPDFVANSSSENPVIPFPSDSAGIYAVTLIVTDEFGCADTLIRNIYVEEEFLFYIPNSFSPNGDGHNEVWKPKGNNVHKEQYHLQIFDRFGHLVFETTDFSQGWNGDVNGGDYYAQNEIYVYIIKARSATTLEKKTFKGHITIIR